MSGRSPQLTIPLRLNELCDFANFHTGANTEVVTRLKQFDADTGFSGVWLWGPTGRGCSHLLQAACQRLEAAGRRALYLPLAELPQDPELLAGMADADLLAVDDIQTWLGSRDTEVALMALYQALLAGGRHLLVAAADTPQRLHFELPDLASRCRALEVFEVRPLDEAGLRVALGAAARRKGLTLEEAVLDFWLHRVSRNLCDLLSDLELLDDAALVEQRRVTIPLIKDVLKL